MPNWNENNLVISGLDQEDIKKFKKLISKENNEEFLDFDKIIPMPEELKDTEAPAKEDSEELVKKYGFSDWYQWSLANWGTKWNSSSCIIDIQDQDENSKGVIYLNFSTAWTPPIPVVKALARIFPKALLSLEFVEPGCLFMGTLTMRNQTVIEETYSEDLKTIKAKYPDWFDDDYEEEEDVSNCCGAKTTEPDKDGMAVCLDCKEGCVIEKEDLLGDKLKAEEQEERAQDIKDLESERLTNSK